MTGRVGPIPVGTGPDRSVPVAEPVQALLLLIPLRQRELSLRDLTGQFSLVFAGVREDSCRPAGTPSPPGPAFRFLHFAWWPGPLFGADGPDLKIAAWAGRRTVRTYLGTSPPNEPAYRSR